MPEITEGYKLVHREPGGRLVSPVLTYMRFGDHNWPGIRPTPWAPGEWVEIPEGDRQGRICGPGVLHAFPDLAAVAHFLLVEGPYIGNESARLYRAELDGVVDSRSVLGVHGQALVFKLATHRMRIVGEPIELPEPKDIDL